MARDSKLDQRRHIIGRSSTGNHVTAPTAFIPQRTLTSVGGNRESAKFSKKAARRIERAEGTTKGAPRYTELSHVRIDKLRRRCSVAISLDERIRFNATPAKYQPWVCAREGKR